MPILLHHEDEYPADRGVDVHGVVEGASVTEAVLRNRPTKSVVLLAHPTILDACHSAQ